MRVHGRYYALTVLALIALLNTLDQSMLSVTAPAIQATFALTDAQIGLLSSAFIIVYGLAALPLGYAVDRLARGRVIAIGVAAWSACTLLTGLVQTFPQILVARALLGVGEASSVPATVSILGDHFAKSERGRAAGVIQAALQLGLAMGLIAGGILAARLGWRSAFLIAAAPGLVLALVAATMGEPARGAAEARGAAMGQVRDAGIPAFGHLLRIRSLLAGILANTFLVLATTGVGAFVAIYLSRRFDVDLAQVGALVGLPLLAGSAAGNAAGGWLLERLSRRSAHAHLAIVLVAAVCAALGLALTFAATVPVTFAVAFLVSTAAGNVAMPALLALPQDLVIPSLRGSAAALQQLSSNLFGRALGVLLIGVLSERWHDVHLALQVVPPIALLVAAGAAALGIASMPRDVAEMERDWARRSAMSRAVEAAPARAS